MLLVAGAQPDAFDKDQNTPVMLSVLSNHNDVVHYLIKTGVSIDLKVIFERVFRKKAPFCRAPTA